MRIRTLQPDMLPALAAFANANFEFDAGKFTPDLLYWHLYRDGHALPGHRLIAETDGQIVGCAFGVARGSEAWIKLFGVEKSCRRRGVATRLFQELEAAFAQADVRRIQIGSAVPLYFMPGVDPRYTPAVCFLEARGYRRNSGAVNMIVRLKETNLDTDVEERQFLERDGIAVSRLIRSERADFAAWMRDAWDDAWQEETELSQQHDPPTTFVAKRNGEFVGFATYDVELFHRSFGPMGVLPEHRKRGLGALLLKRCLRAMRDRGDELCEIAWVGPIAFYSRAVGARIDTTFFQYSKRLDYSPS